MQGVRVLDLSRGRAGAYCTRLLAAVGAHVVVGEPREGAALRQQGRVGDPEVSVVWEYLQAFKDGTEVGPEDSVVDLAGGYEVVVLDVEGDAGSVSSLIDELTDVYPALVVVVISPYGLSGPKADWMAGPLEDWALGGLMTLNGERDREPLPGGGAWATHLVGATAAIGAQAAMINARATGAGDLVDVGAEQALVNCHQWTFTILSHNGIVKQRWGNRHGEQHHPLSIHPCSDGWICVAAVSRHQWEGLCIAMDQVELLADETLYVPAVRFDRADELDVIINGWTQTQTVEDAVRILQENQTPVGPVASLFDTLAETQLEVRNYWAAADHLGASVKMPGLPFVIPGAAPEYRPAPSLAKSPASSTTRSPIRREERYLESSLPLSGVRVVEFSIAWAGPLVCRFLGDLGADVIKIEHPTARGLAMPDPALIESEAGGWEWGQLPGPLSRNGIFMNNKAGPDWFNRMGHWNKMNRSKRSLCLDVKGPGGQEVLEALVSSADLVVNNYSPRGVRSLGIGHDSLRAIKPDLVTADLSGYGATGPEAHRISWGPVLDAASGLASSTGYSDSGPYKQGLALPDAIGGIHGTVAVLGALWQRWLTGEAVHVDMSQLETAVAVGGDQLLEVSLTGRQPPRRGARSVDHAPAGVYRAAGEDDWLVLSVHTEAAWTGLVSVIGSDLDRDEWRSRDGRMANHDEIDTVIEGWTTGRSKHDAVLELQQVGVRSAAVMTSGDLYEDPQLVEQGFFVDLDLSGEEEQIFPGFPIGFENTPVHLRRAPRLGEHNEEVLLDLGFTIDQISTLEVAGVLADEPPG